MNDEGEYEGQHTVSFTQTSWLERIHKFIPYLPREIPLFATVVISFWGIAKVISEVAGNNLNLKSLAAPILITALVVAVYKAIYRFRAYVPGSLASESKLAQLIFRKGKCGWQFALARQMLKERTDSFDRTLEQVERGSQFIYPRQLDADEYVTWLKERPEVLLRLLRAVAKQCVSEAPSILAITKSEANLSELRDSVNRLSSLYEVAVDFELQSHATQPPAEFREIHEMIYGWSSPIRLGIQKFIDILKSVSEISAKDIKRKAVAPPSFQIKFESPPNVDEFVKQLNSISL